MTLKWEGEKLLDKSRRAQRQGVDATMQLAVVSAKSNHEWKNRTGTLEGSLQVTEAAQDTGSGAAGSWGSTDVAYALIHELGGQAGSATIPPRPYLRPAADREYPGLAKRIRKAFQR